MSSSFLQRGAAAYVIVGGLVLHRAGPAWSEAPPAALPNAALPKGRSAGPVGRRHHRVPPANGLKVLLFPDSSRPTVTVNVTYLVGSRHENYGETGMAHLLEHLMFKGAPNHRDITAQFSDRGMQFNGTTSLDRTNYYEVFQASPGQPAVGAGDGSRPHDPFLHRPEGPRFRDDGRAQRIRERREFARLGADEAHAERRLRLARLRPLDDRQQERHRERPHQEPAGLLPHLLPAR
jgi:hypothetical protein